MKAAQQECTEEQRKSLEKGMTSGNSKEAYQQQQQNTRKALTKTQQRKSAVIEGSSETILMENTAVRNRWPTQL